MAAGCPASGSLGSGALPATMHATVGHAAAIEAAMLLRSVTVPILQRHPLSGVDQHGFLWEPELVLGRTGKRVARGCKHVLRCCEHGMKYGVCLDGSSKCHCRIVGS